jgi:hypothetical protein
MRAVNILSEPIERMNITVHIPDNYLSPSTCAVMAAAMVPVWTVSVKK